MSATTRYLRGLADAAFGRAGKSPKRQDAEASGPESGPSAALPWSFAGAGGYMSGASAWTGNRSEQVRHFKYWTYVALNRVCEAVATTMPNVSVARDASALIQSEDRQAGALSAKARFLSPYQRAKALVPLQMHEELEPVGMSHPLVRLLRGANYDDTGYDLWYETVMYLGLTGSAYWWLPENAAGLPAEAWVIPSHWMWPVANPAAGPGEPLVSGWRVRAVEASSAGVILPAGEVIQFKRKSPVSKLDGWSPSGAGARWIDSAESVDKARWHSFRNGPMPGLKVEFETQMPDDALLNRLEARIEQRYSGEHMAGKPMFVPPGAKVSPLVMTPRELDFKNSAEQLRDFVLALYGVNLAVVGLTKNMTSGSVLGAQTGFCKWTINPLLGYLGQVLTEKLARRYDESLRVWWPDQTPDDPAVRERELQTDIMAGALSVNELRAARGRRPWPSPEADELIPGLAQIQAQASQAGRVQGGEPGVGNGQAPDVAGGKQSPQPRSNMVALSPGVTPVLPPSAVMTPTKFKALVRALRGR